MASLLRHCAMAVTISACILQSVTSDGYPKEAPEKPFNTGVFDGSQGNHLSEGGGVGGSSGGDVSYPPVSMDYTSRYRGPIAMLMVLPDGHIADTAEVTAARTAHLASLDKAKALWYMQGAGGSQSTAENHQGDQGQKGSHSDGAANGNEGYSYSQADSASLNGGSSISQEYGVPQGGTATHGSQTGQGSASAADASSNKPYEGPLAMLMVLPDGYIADTDEVSAARAAHLAILDKANALWSMQMAGGSQSGPGTHHGDQGNNGSPTGGANGDQGYSYPPPDTASLNGGSGISQDYGVPQEGPATQGAGYAQGGVMAAGASLNIPYDGPLAMLMVLPSGFLADTPEIAALKSAHLSALMKAQAAWKPQDWKQ